LSRRGARVRARFAALCFVHERAAALIIWAAIRTNLPHRAHSKQNNYEEGTCKVTSGDSTLASVTFDFEPHWRETVVSVAVGFHNSSDTLAINVTNQFGDSTIEEVRC